MNSSRFRPLFDTLEVALDSSREALPFYATFGSCGWLVEDREVAGLARVFRSSGWNSDFSGPLLAVIVTQSIRYGFELDVAWNCALYLFCIVADDSYEDARASGNTALSSPCWDLLATMRRVVNYHSSWARQRQFDVENPLVLISSGLLVQSDEGASSLVVDRIDESTAINREAPDSETKIEDRPHDAAACGGATPSAIAHARRALAALSSRERPPMVARPPRILGDASHAWRSAAVRLVACTGRSKSSASRESSRYAARALSQLRWPAVATLVEGLRTMLPPG
ncbi:titin [Dorcoceras hygrometricum]|uniref:Titin n=1 Tax=Dorcoceras hygrometricum TaxID=472368 RepID=A0A2Z7D6Z8_9LAMI|nr:titin [Dorcoceras hygrometricum]